MPATIDSGGRLSDWWLRLRLRRSGVDRVARFLQQVRTGLEGSIGIRFNLLRFQIDAALTRAGAEGNPARERHQQHNRHKENQRTHVSSLLGVGGRSGEQISRSTAAKMRATGVPISGRIDL
jgi:hypothetical protein